MSVCHAVLFFFFEVFCLSALAGIQTWKDRSVPDLGKGLSESVPGSFWPRLVPRSDLVLTSFVTSLRLFFFSMFGKVFRRYSYLTCKTSCKHILAAKTNFNLTMVPALAFPWCLASQLPFLDIFKSCLWHWVFTYELYPTYPSSTRVSIVTCTQNICAKHALDIYFSPSGHAKQNNKDPKTHCIPYAFPWWNHQNAMT